MYFTPNFCANDFPAAKICVSILSKVQKKERRGGRRWKVKSPKFLAKLLIHILILLCDNFHQYLSEKRSMFSPGDDQN